MLTHKRLVELLSYDKETGVFTWRMCTSPVIKVGDVAGTTQECGRVRIQIECRFYYAHRLAWFYMKGRWPPHQIDHRDTDQSNNRWNNLRRATNAQNGQNKRKARSDNKCGLLGVSAYKGGRWMARIKVSGKAKHLGYFSTKELAHQAYLKAKAAVHPFQTFGLLEQERK